MADESLQIPQVPDPPAHRRNMRVRVFAFDDPEQEYDPAIKDMSISERIALVFEATRRGYAMRGIRFDDLRLSRHVAHVERRPG